MNDDLIAIQKKCYPSFNADDYNKTTIYAVIILSNASFEKPRKLRVNMPSIYM